MNEFNAEGTIRDGELKISSTLKSTRLYPPEFIQYVWYRWFDFCPDKQKMLSLLCMNISVSQYWVLFKSCEYFFKEYIPIEDNGAI